MYVYCIFIMKSNKINIDLYCENGFLRAISNQCEMYQNSISNKAYQQYYRMFSNVSI